MQVVLNRKAFKFDFPVLTESQNGELSYRKNNVELSFVVLWVMRWM